MKCVYRAGIFPSYLSLIYKTLEGYKVQHKIGKILFQIKNPDTGVVVQDQRVGGNKGAVCIVPWNEMRDSYDSTF